MKKVFFGLSAMGVLIAMMLVIDPVTSKDRDWNECLEKYDSKWDTECSNCMVSTGTYKVSLRNVCAERIDCMVCVQEKYKNWRCYTQLSLAPKDTIYGYACKGAGRYLYWVKRAGDSQTSFPSVEEVNASYAD